MHVEVNWSTVCFGLILLAAGVIAAVTYCFLESRRIAAEERHQRRDWERDMASAELPEWNGETYEWTPESLAYLADSYVSPLATAELPVLREEPVPASTVSGPLPQLDDGDDFLARMRAETDAFRAAWGIS